MTIDTTKAFKRLNFFRGFLTTEQDWNDSVAYHREKHRLHNRLFHGIGIVPGFAGELRVQARGKGEMAVEIRPGLAIDGSGDEILLPDPEIKAINLDEFKPPQTIYVVAKYYEELTDFVAYKENLGYKGHRRVSEVGRVEIQVVEPDAGDVVELARIALEPGVKRITDARDPLNPQPNEIDLRFAPIAGVVGTRIPGVYVEQLLTLLREMQEVYGFLFHAQKMTTAGDVSHACITLNMMMQSRLVDMWNLYTLWRDVLGFQWGFIEDVEANHPEFSNRKEFLSLKRHIELLRDFAREGRYDLDYLKTLIGYETKGNDNLRAIFSERLKKVVAEEVASTPIEKIADILKLHSGKFKKKMDVEGVSLKLVDEINVLNPDSETSHDFKIVEPRDKYRSRQKLKYPDGKVVEDTGIAYEGGHCEFTIKNVVPGRPVLLLVRMDYVHGDWEAEIQANGKKAGVMRCPGEDRKFRWRNWPFIVDADFVNDVEIKFVQTPVTAERDLNFFHVWAYQPKD